MTPVYQIKLYAELWSSLVVAPSSHLRHLSIRSGFVDVSGLVSGRGSELPFATRLRRLSIRSSFVHVSGLVPGRTSELPFATPVDQIKLRECVGSDCQTWPQGLICDDCRENRASSMFLVSFLNLAPRANLRCLSNKSSFVYVSGFVFEPGSEGSFSMPVE